MSFLTPLFLAGIALVAGPIIFHLIRQAPRNRVVFSSTEFLEASPPRAKQRSRIQNPLLLLLRCLAIALLALAFARPFFSSDNPASLAMDVKRDVVLVVDESASMSRDGVWEAALEQIEAVIEGVGEGDRLSIIAFTDVAEKLVTAEQWTSWASGQRAQRSLAALEDRRPSDYPGALDVAIESALHELELIRESRARQGLGEIILVSDFAAGSSISGLAGIEWPSNVSLKRIQVETPVATKTPNLSLRWLGWAERSGEAAAARLALVTDQPTTPIEASISVFRASDGQRIATTPIRRVAREPQSLVTIDIPLEDMGAPLRFAVEAQDAADFDNILPVAPQHVPTSRIYHYGSGEASNPESAAYFLAKAIAGIQSPNVQLISGERAATARQSPDAIVIHGSINPDAIDQVGEALRQGADVLIIVNTEQQTELLDELSGEAGWSVQPTGLNNVLYGDISFRHPLFSQYSDARYSNFTSIRVWRPFAITPPPSLTPEVLARFEDENMAVLELSIGQGRLIVWAHGWSPKDSNWVLSTKFVPWLHRFASRSIGGQPPPSNAILDSKTPAAYGGVDDWSRLVDGEQQRPAPPQHAGLYRATIGDAPIWIALQHAPSESNLIPFDQEAWDQLGLPEQTPGLQQRLEQQLAAREQARNALETEQQQRIWRWLLLAALAVLMLESAISILVGKRREHAAA